jgi:acetoin utilization protein AcuC
MLEMPANPDAWALIYSSRFEQFSFGEEHPFKIMRYRLTYELLCELGLVEFPGVRMVECPLASESALAGFHEPGYVATLKEFSLDETPRANFRYGLGDIENPIFPGVFDWALLGCGGTIEAARLVVEEGVRVVFNMAGGYHHAHAARASGFSYLNDAVVAIQDLVRRGLRVAYVDIDAHHGDGVQEAFYTTDQVLTVSLHESGEDFFPHTGFSHELGEGAGYGYSVNLPFYRHSDDLIFEQGFARIVGPLLKAFKPDVLVTQMGVDTLRTDPLTRLEMTTGAIEYAAREFLATGIPWVCLGGGGYEKINVARCWALLWSIIIGVEVSDLLPPGFVSIIRKLGYADQFLRDRPHSAQPNDFARAQVVLEKNLSFLERKLFPLHGVPPRGGR